MWSGTVYTWCHPQEVRTTGDYRRPPLPLKLRVLGLHTYCGAYRTKPVTTSGPDTSHVAYRTSTPGLSAVTVTRTTSPEPSA